MIEKVSQYAVVRAWCLYPIGHRGLSENKFDGLMSWCLIPLHSVAVTAALVIFQSIGQRCGVATEGEVV